MEIISIIPARGGSKGIPLKNLKIICGKPMLDYTVNASLNSKLIKTTFVSSDHAKIIQRAKKLGAEVINRPKQFARDTSTTESTMIHCIERLEKKGYKPDIIILLQNTSPLRTTKHIDEAINIFLKGKYDSLLSGYLSHHFIWEFEKQKATPINYNPKKRPRRQNFKNQFIENGAIYITKYSNFVKSKSRISGKIGFYEMSEKTSLDIDTFQDLKKAKKILEFKNSGNKD